MSKQKLNSEFDTECLDCGSNKLVMDKDRGEFVCSVCGLVVQENIINRDAEWRAFNPQEMAIKVRTGAPSRYFHYDKGLSTIIRREKDIHGRSLSPHIKRKLKYLKRWNYRSKFYSSKMRNLGKAMNELQRLSEKLHIPSQVQEDAAIIYRKALNAGLLKGRKILVVVAAALYAACRQSGINRNLNEITKVSFGTRKEISRNYRVIVNDLEMKMPVNKPLEQITKIAEKTGLSPEIEGLAIKIIREAEKKKITPGKSPQGIAAAALYLAAKMKNQKISQTELAKAADTTDVTLRNINRKIIDKLNIF